MYAKKLSLIALVLISIEGALFAACGHPDHAGGVCPSSLASAASGSAAVLTSALPGAPNNLLDNATSNATTNLLQTARNVSIAIIIDVVFRDLYVRLFGSSAVPANILEHQERILAREEREIHGLASTKKQLEQQLKNYKVGTEQYTAHQKTLKAADTDLTARNVNYALLRKKYTETAFQIAGKLKPIHYQTTACQNGNCTHKH